jgi:hypothetical protein
MKNYTLLLFAALMITACSSPKYTYHFDHYDYNSGKKARLAQTETKSGAPEVSVSPLLLDNQTVTASGEATPAPAEIKKSLAADKEAIQKKIASMSSEEKKELKRELKAEVKKIIKAKKSGDHVNALKDKKGWDADLKWAAIFGAIGLVLTALGGVNTVFWVLGAVALVVALIFLIMWLSRQ